MDNYSVEKQAADRLSEALARQGIEWLAIDVHDGYITLRLARPVSNLPATVLDVPVQVYFSEM